MNDTDAKNQLLDTLKVGSYYQILLLLVEQAFVWDKEDTIKSLGEVFAKFASSLSDEEKKEFQEKLDKILATKVEEIGSELSKQIHPNELEEIKKELEQFSTQATSQTQE